MKKYIVESWIRDRQEYDTLEEAKRDKKFREENNDTRKDTVIIEVETTEKKL